MIHYTYISIMKTQRDTPEWLAKKMGAMFYNEGIEAASNLKGLEPSAGTGILADHLAKWTHAKITCVELNKEKCDALIAKQYNTIHGDFLNIEFKEKFNFIIAAPPFKDNVDVIHIQKMYELLQHWGTIVTLTSPFWLTNNETHQVTFREFLKDKKHTLEMLPDNTFIEKGKTVPTAILTLYKK